MVGWEVSRLLGEMALQYLGLRAESVASIIGWRVGRSESDLEQPSGFHCRVSAFVPSATWWVRWIGYIVTTSKRDSPAQEKHGRDDVVRD